MGTVTFWYWKFGSLHFFKPLNQEAWYSEWYALSQNDDLFAECVEIDGQSVDLDAHEEYQRHVKEVRERVDKRIEQIHEERKQMVCLEIRHPYELLSKSRILVEAKDVDSYIGTYGFERVTVV